MAEETTQLIIGDAAADAVGQPRKRRFFAKRKKHEKKLTTCENCGAALAGEYCSACSQHAIDYRRSIWRVAVDALDSFFNWDTKFLKTTGVLLTRPGKLTNDFNAGRRVRYVHPLRLYLLASIAFFLVVKLVNVAPQMSSELEPTDRAELDSALAELSSSASVLSSEQREQVEAARALWSRGTSPMEPEKSAELERALKKLPRWNQKKELEDKDKVKLEAALQRVTEAIPKPGEKDGGEEATVNPSTAGASPSGDESPGLTTNWEGSNSPFGKFMAGRIKEKIGEHGSNAKLFLETLRSNIPTMMLCCIPLFAFVLKVLYLRQRRFYVEHLVYALHIHTFVYVGVVVITLLATVLERWTPALQTPLVLLLSFALTAQVFLSIRRVYQQGWFMTILKFCVGGVAYSFVLALALGATAFVTLLIP